MLYTGDWTGEDPGAIFQLQIDTYMYVEVLSSPNCLYFYAPGAVKR